MRSGPGRWAARLAWAAGCAAAWAVLLSGAADTFYIENTGDQLRRAERGAALALVAGLVLVGLAFAPCRLRSRAPRLAGWLVGAPAAVSALLLQWDASLVGLLAAVVLTPVAAAGVVAGLVPARRAQATRSASSAANWVR